MLPIENRKIKAELPAAIPNIHLLNINLYQGIFFLPTIISLVPKKAIIVIHKGLINVIAGIKTGKLIEVEVLLSKFKNSLKLLSIKRVIKKNIISKLIFVRE